MKKREFDVIVIGAGSGLNISSAAAGLGYNVAVIDQGPFGGTCLNRGCIPYKMLICVSDIAETIKRSKLFGISSKIAKVNWKSIINYVNKIVSDDANQIEQGNRKSKNITVFKAHAEFIDEKLLKVGNQIITAPKIFICAGARPFVPPIPGLKNVPFVTSREALQLKKLPKRMVIIGGGYIGCEAAHLFGSFGTKVTIVDRGNLLVKSEDSDIAKRFTEVYKKRFNVILNAGITKVHKQEKEIICEFEINGKKKRVKSDVLFIATGRIPNTDVLAVEKTGVELDKRKFVQVDDFMETNVKGVWAIGDIAGKYMFKHSANWEANAAFFNAFGKKQKVDYTAMPHAIFAGPQVAGVGKTEDQLKKEKMLYKKNIYPFNQTAYGFALHDNDGFVKVLWHPETKKILGCHIIGMHASILIHEVIVAMKAGLGIRGITNTIHVHPALSEVVQRAFLPITDQSGQKAK